MSRLIYTRFMKASFIRSLLCIAIFAIPHVHFGASKVYNDFGAWFSSEVVGNTVDLEFYTPLIPSSSSNSLDTSYPTVSGSGYALKFSPGNYARIPNLSVGNKFTVSMWVKFDTEIKSNGSRQDIMYGINYARPHLSANRESDGKIGFYTQQQNSQRDIKTTKSQWDANKWYHLAFTFKSGEQKVYVNGILDASYSYNGGFTNWGGVTLSRSSGGFSGALDELSVWSDNLNQSTIQGLINSKITNSHSKLNKLQAYFRFDYGTGNTLYDLSKNANGTLHYTSSSKWVVSGAPIGDTSNISIGSSASASIIMNNGGAFTASASQGFSSNEGIQIYYSQSAPNVTTLPTGVDSIFSSFGYIGVNKIGDPTDQYTVVANYSSISGLSNTQKKYLVLLKRENDLDSTWEIATNASHNNLSTGVITLPGQTGTQYVLGTVNAFTDATVYFTNQSAGTILKVKNNGTGFGTIASSLSGASSIAYDATNDFAFVYRANTIIRMKGDGTSQTTIVTGQSSTRDVVVDPDNQVIYFSDYNGGTIKKCSYTGSGLTTVKSGIQPLGIYLDITNQVIYWADLGGSYIGKVNVDGTGTTTLVTGQADIRDVAYDDVNNTLYWCRGNQNTLYKKVGTGSATSLITGASGIYGIDLDVENQVLYWAEYSTGRIKIARTDGTNNTTLYTSSGPLYVSFGRKGEQGGALAFDGSNDYVALADTVGNTGMKELSIEAWIKVASSTGNFQAIVSNAGNNFIHFQAYSAGNIAVYTDNGAIYLPIIPETPYGVWKHVAVTVKSGESKVYVNGVQVGSTVTTAFNSINVDNNNSIGRGFSSTRYFKGEIDEVRIWNRALCQVEIQSRLSCSLDTASAAGLLSYYDFANGVAGGTNTGLTTLLDNSGNGHNGTLTNLALTGTASNWVSQSDSVSFNSCGAFSNTSSPVIVADKNPQVYINSSGTANVSTASLYTSASVGCGSITSVVASDTSFGCNDAIDSLPVTSGVLTFDGTNDYVTLGASGTLKPTSNVTVEAWVYMNSWTGAPTFVGNTQGSGYAIYQASNNKVRFIARRNGTYGLVENSTVLSSGWHHIAGTYDGRYCRLYVDGNLVGTDDAGGNYSIQYVGNSTLIGAEVSGGTAPTGGYLNGKMDEVRIWNVARTSSQIQSAYKSSLTGNESGLLAYYDFEDGNGSTLTDQAGSLNGSLVNMNTSSVWGAENVYTYYGIPVVLTATDNASNQVKDTVYVNLVDTIAPTLSLTTNTSKRIGIIGPLGSYGAYWSQLSAAFAAQGHTVAFSQTGAASASQLTNLDYLFVFRVNAAVNNDVKTWVNNGGFLFAEWDATNVFNLGMLSGSHGSTFNTNANLNWQSTSLANQIKAGMSSPTNMSTGSGYYRQVNVSGSTEIHAVRAANSGEVLLAGAAYGSGYAMVCGAALPDLANSFPNSDQEKMFKNLVGTGSTVNLLPDTLYLNASGTATIPTSGLSSAAADNCGTPTVSIVGGATLDCDDIGGSGFSTGSEFWYHGSNGIYSSSTTSPSAQLRFSQGGYYHSVAYDYNVNKVFYVKRNTGIYKSDPNGSNEVLLYNGLSDVYNLTLDVFNQRVIVSDYGNQSIKMVNYDGTGGSVVKGSLGHNPMGITYDEVNDLIYWTDWNNSGIVRSIKPDGSNYNSNVFTVSGVGSSGGISVDPSTNTFYIGDHSNSRILKKVGSNSPTILVSGISGVWAIDLDRTNNKVYYTCYTTGIIGSVNTDGTSNTNLITGTSNNLSINLSKGSSGAGMAKFAVQATDGGNNSTYDTAYVTLLDTISPTLSLRNDTLYLNSNGTTDTLTASDLIVSASDNCGIADTTLDSLGYFTCSSVGIDSVSITVTDSSDNSTTAFAYITVLDTLSPTISCASNVSASSSVNCNAVVSVPSPNVVDNCGSCSTAPFDSSNTNLMVWLDATKYNGTHNSSLSGIMTDVSGYTRSITTDATYESTGLNGKPAMLHNNNRTIVGNNFTTTANTYVFIALEMTGYGTATASTFHHGSRDYGVVLEKNGGSTQWHFQTGNDNTNVNQNISLNTPYIMACKLENNNQRSFTLYKNDGSGNLQNLGTVSNSSFNVQIGSGVFYIGKSDVNEYSQMKLGEFIYFQNSVPVADSIIVNYLFDKWLSNSTSASTCDGITLTNNFNNTADASGTYPLGSTKVIWTATDASGNSDTCSMYVTVNPSSNSFTVKTDTFYLDSNGTARIIADSLYTGNCGGLTVNLSDTTAYCTDLSGLGGAGSTGDSLYFRTSSSKIGGSSLTNPGIVDLSSTTINTYAVEFDANVKKVFYMDLSNARIVKSNSDGSGLVSLATGISSCYDIELDPINQVVYWVEYRGSRRIMKVNYDGTGLTTLGTVSYSVFGFHFDIASQTLVFSDWNGGGKIGKINADGTGKNEAIFNTGHGSIANVNYNSSTDTYYWSVYSGTGSGTIHKRVGTGGATTTVIGSLGNILGFDIDFNNSKIYFIDWNSYIVKRVDLDGSNLITFLSGMGYSSYQLSLAKTGFGSGTTKAVYLTVTDTNSSSFNDTTYVTILDTISPNVNASNDTVFLNQDGLVILDSINVVPGGIGGSNVSDNCAVESLTYSQDTLTIQHLGANSIAVTVTDSSGNSFTDSVIVFVKDGDAPYAGLGNKLYFDGSNDRVDIAHDASLNLNSFTAEAWFRTTQTAGSYKRILIKRVSSGGQNYSLAIHNGKPHVRMDASGGKQAEGSDNVNDGLWHHIAGVHNTSTNELILYLDGNEVAKTTGVLSPSTGSFPLSIGGASGFSQNFEGDLDEIRVWNVAKTAQDIKDNYRIRANSSDPSLVAYYNFDSEVGLALNDVSSNSNHGTLVNMASNLWTDSHDSLVWEYNENEVIHDTVAWATAWDKIEGDSLTFYPISGFGSLFTLDSITGAITFDGIFDYEEKSTYPLMYGVYDLSGNIDTAVSVVSVIDDTTEVVYAGMGNALSFDNVNDKVSIPHNTAYNTSEFTISTWVYWEGSGATVDFISGKGLEAYEIHTGGDAGVNSIRFIPAVGVWLDAPVGSFEPNKWNHVAVAYKPSGGMAKIYINGKDVGYTNRGMNGLTSSIPNSTDPLTIGNRHSSANFPFEGSIDEYQLWDRMLDSNEVVAVMNRRGNLADSDLVLNLNFDKNSGVDKVTDLTANGNNGQLVGFSGNPWGDGPDSLFFRISEETPTGDTVAYALGFDSDGSDLSFRFISGNTRNSFNLDSLTGVITVQDVANLKYYVDSSYVLEYEVIENGDGNRDTAYIDIRLNNENAPPAISFIGNDTICAAGIGDSLLFSITDLDPRDSTAMVLTAHSYDTLIIPNSSVVFYNTTSGDSGRAMRIYLPDSAVSTQSVKIDIVVTDLAGLSDTTQITVLIDSLPSIDLGIDTTFCYNTTFTINSGSGKGTYVWNTSASSDAITINGTDRNTFGDTYYVGITDANGCFNSDTVIVDTLQVPAFADSTFNVLCKGDATATITLDGVGGQPGYTFNWDASVTSTSGTGDKVAESLIAGTYAVTITDDNDCQDSTTYTVTEPYTSISISKLDYEEVFCKTDSTGWVSVGTNGGTGAYVYAWDDFAGQTDTLLDGVPTGTYEVVVTDANGCQDSLTHTVTEPSLALDIWLSDSLDIYCRGDETGYLEVTNNGGGTGAVTYQWNDLSLQTTAKATGLGSGSYKVIATDSLGCQDSVGTFVPEPATSVSVSIDSTFDIKCKSDSTGFITALAADGTGNKTYAWNDNAGQTSATASNLAKGVYQVIVTDSLGCTDSTTAQLFEPNKKVDVLITAKRNVFCKTDSTGLAAATITGGVKPYVYQWNDYAAQTDSLAEFLPAGTYKVLVTDSNNCQDSITQVITEPTMALTLSLIDSVKPLCSTDTVGWISVNSAGGTPGYSYLWNDNLSQTDTLADGLTPGTYGVTVTDILGCKDSATQTLSEIDSLTASFTLSKDVFCNTDTFITLSGLPANDGVFAGAGVSGNSFRPFSTTVGQHVISYTRMLRSCMAVGYDTLVVNPNPVASITNFTTVCNNTPTFALSQGRPFGGVYYGTRITSDSIYSAPSVAGFDTVNYVYTNGFGCKDSATRVITISPKPTVAFASLANVCADTVPFTLTQGSPVSGGSGFYTGVAVNNGKFYTSIAGVGVDTLTYHFTTNIGCTDSAAQTITVDSLPVPVITSTYTDKCINEPSFALNNILPLGGTYSGNGVTSNTFSPSSAATGTHTIAWNFTDGNGCKADTSVPITVRPKPTVSFASLNDVCLDVTPFNLSAGSPTGGYYKGSGVQSDSISFNPSAAGAGSKALTYVFENTYGCIDSAAGTQLVDTLPNVYFTQSLPTICLNDRNTAINFGTPASQGLGVYSGKGVVGNNIFTAQSGSGIHVVTYTFTDNNGCTSFADTSILVDTVPTVTLATFAPVCADLDSVQLIGGSPSNGVYFGSSLISNPSGNNYYLDVNTGGARTDTLFYTFTNANGCSDTVNQLFVVNPLPIVSLNLGFDSICRNTPTLSLSGGSPAGGVYSGPGINNGNFNSNGAAIGNNAIVYTYTNSNSCTARDTDYVRVDSIPLINLSSVLPRYCQTDAPDTLRVGTGLTANGSAWYTGRGILTDGLRFSAVAAGTGNHAVTYNYSVKGCVNDTTFNVRVNANPIVNLSPINAVCENADTFKLTGGSPVGSSGVYKGTGVTNGFFYPSVAQNGNYTIKYVYVNPATQCRDSASRVVSVYQAPKVTMTAFSQLCSDAAPFKLTQGTTTSSSGGSATYKGTGVNQADTTFNPAVAGAGAHEIWYVHSDTNGCADSTSKYLAVNPVPITTFSSVGNVCQNKAAFPLTQGTTFSFNAKSDEYYKIGGVKLPGNSMFNPASYPGNSTLSVTYVFEDVKGCVDSSVQTIKVDTTPIVNFAPLNGFCTNQGTYRLVEGTPVSGGTGYYYGQSVLGGIFFPQFMGPGSNTLSYVFTNLNGCSDTASTGVLVKSAPVISLSALASICENEDTLLLNTASVTPTAGYGNYFGTGIDSTGGNVIRIDSLSVGSYLIKYVHQDTVGGFTCSDSAFQSLIVNAKPTIYLKTAPELCETESKLLNFGIPTGGMYYDSTGVGIAQNTFIGSTFGVGTHKVVYEYSDINGCTDTASSFIDVLASPSVSLNMPDNSFCLATGIVSLSGGQPKGGNYSGNGIFQNQLYTSSAGLGTHRVVYRYQDSTGCSSSDTSQLVIVPNPKVVVSNDTVICSNSRIKLYASGLGLRATYDWGNGLVQDSITVNPNSTTTYKVIATDSNSCSANGKVRVEVNPEIILTTSSQNSACGESTGAATVLATGGLPPFQYLWSNGVKQTLNKALKSGVYVVTVSDGNNCNENAAVTISDIGGVQITVNTVTNPTCFGGDDGSIDINIIGSATKIEWSNGYLNEDLSNVAAGKYTVKVTDSKGCLTIKEFTLEDPDKLVAEAVVSKPSCGDTNGVVALNVAGGTGGYVFTWNDGSSNDSLVNITSGLYSVEIKDGNNCSDSVFVSVADSGAPVIALKRLVPTNCGTNDGEISIVVSSDSLKNVLWSNGDSITTIVGLASGRYNVTATDLAGCQSQAYYKVNLILPGSQPICVTTIDTATGLSTVIQNATGNITKVRLYSVASGTDDLIKLQEVPNTQNKITDFAVSFSAGAKTYGMTVIDACGNESELSSLHSPIYLTSSIDARGNISLQWSNYNGFTIVDYEVVRMTDKGNVVVRTIPYPTNSTVIADETFEGTFIKYFVRAAAPSNCSSDPYYDYTWSNLSADFAGFETKIANVQMLGGYRIYPNPNKGEFKIELLIENATDVSVTVQDVSGRKIHANVYENMTGFNVIPMQVAGLANGMYQVIIETGEGERIIEKIQVTR